MSEASDDRKFRELNGEVSCPGCGRLLSEDDIAVIEENNEKRIFCRHCSAEIGA